MPAPAAPPVRPRLRRSLPHDWRPLTGAERAWLAQVLDMCGLREGGRGRPGAHSLLARAEACLEACARRLRWADAATAAAPGLHPEALRRCFLRWARRGVWKAMLRAMRFAGAPSPAMEWFVCLAFRRARRVHGLAGIALARRFGFASALPAPPRLVADPFLSASCLERAARHLTPGAGACAKVVEAVVRLLGATLRLVRGPSRVPRAARAGW